MQRGYEQWAIVATIDPVDANNADTSTDEIDMANYSELMAIISVGAIASSGTFDFLLEAASSSGGSFTTITGKSITQLTDSDDNKQVVMGLNAEELATGKRYVRGTMANSAHAQLVSVVILGKPKYGPAREWDLSSVDEIVT